MGFYKNTNSGGSTYVPCFKLMEELKMYSEQNDCVPKLVQDYVDDTVYLVFPFTGSWGHANFMIQFLKPVIEDLELNYGIRCRHKVFGFPDENRTMRVYISHPILREIVMNIYENDIIY